MSDEVIKYTADVVCVRGGEVLLIERGNDPHKGKLALPGGHVNDGETALEAAARELWEETGISVGPQDLMLVGVYDEPDRDPRGRYVSVAFLALVGPDTEAKAGDDAAAAKWVGYLELFAKGPVNIAFDHGAILGDGLSLLNVWRR